MHRWKILQIFHKCVKIRALAIKSNGIEINWLN